MKLLTLNLILLLVIPSAYAVTDPIGPAGPSTAPTSVDSGEEVKKQPSVDLPYKPSSDVEKIESTDIKAYTPPPPPPKEIPYIPSKSIDPTAPADPEILTSL